MAAKEALDKLEEQLNCPICLDTYTDPKLLQCHHVYCRKCLVKLVFRDRDQQEQLCLTCPHCRHTTCVPAKGVSGLQSAFHINYLLEIQDSLKKIRITPTPVQGEVECDANDHSPMRKVTNCCSEHSSERLELYCETCGELICFHCAIKGGKHHTHDHQLLTKAYEKYRKEIVSSFEPMEKQLKAITKAVTHLDAQCVKINSQQASIETDIHSTMRKLRETLYARETALVDELRQITQSN